MRRCPWPVCAPCALLALPRLSRRSTSTSTAVCQYGIRRLLAAGGGGFAMPVVLGSIILGPVPQEQDKRRGCPSLASSSTPARQQQARWGPRLARGGVVDLFCPC